MKKERVISWSSSDVGLITRKSKITWTEIISSICPRRMVISHTYLPSLVDPKYKWGVNCRWNFIHKNND